jgi:hypothetical protein
MDFIDLRRRPDIWCHVSNLIRVCHSNLLGHAAVLVLIGCNHKIMTMIVALECRIVFATISTKSTSCIRWPRMSSAHYHDIIGPSPATAASASRGTRDSNAACCTLKPREAWWWQNQDSSDYSTIGNTECAKGRAQQQTWNLGPSSLSNKNSVQQLSTRGINSNPFCTTTHELAKSGYEYPIISFPE